MQLDRHNGDYLKYKVKTEADGHFVFANIEPGQYGFGIYMNLQLTRDNAMPLNMSIAKIWAGSITQAGSRSMCFMMLSFQAPILLSTPGMWLCWILC